MLTNEDVAKLAAILATKDDVAHLRLDTENMRDDAVREVIATVEDGLAEVADEWSTKEAELARRLDQQEAWIRKIAAEADIDLSGT